MFPLVRRPHVVMAVVFVLACCVVHGQNQLIFLHRHGARLEPQLKGGGFTWAHADLTTAGKEMGRQLGYFLLRRYPHLLQHAHLNDSSYVVQSTEVARTVQTALSVLSVLFPSDPTPMVPHTPRDRDFLLAFNGNYPSTIVRRAWHNAINMENRIADQYINSSDLSLLSSTVGFDCTGSSMLCALLGEDIAQCRRSNGGMTPELLTLFETKLETLQMIRNKYIFGFNSTGPYRPAGSVGHKLASRMLSDAKAWINGSNRQTRVYQYSAHDDTVVGLLNTLGAATFDSYDVHLWVPKFTQTVLFEVFEADQSMQFYLTMPNETHGSGYRFEDHPLPLRVGCVLSNGSTVHASRCSIDGVARFIARSAPTVPDGECYLSAEDAATLCNPTMVGGPVSVWCQIYRSMCPSYACSASSSLTLDSQRGICVPSYSGASTTMTPFSGHIGLYIGVVLASIVVGLLVGVLILRCLTTKQPPSLDSSKGGVNEA